MCGEEMVLQEILDDTVELGALVAESRRTNSQGPKVLGGLGDGLSLENNGQIHQNVEGSLVVHTPPKSPMTTGCNAAPWMLMSA